MVRYVRYITVTSLGVHDARAVARARRRQHRQRQRRAPRRPRALHAPSRDDWLEQRRGRLILCLYTHVLWL